LSSAESWANPFKSATESSSGLWKSDAAAFASESKPRRRYEFSEKRSCAILETGHLKRNCSLDLRQEGIECRRVYCLNRTASGIWRQKPLRTACSQPLAGDCTRSRLRSSQDDSESVQHAHLTMFANSPKKPLSACCHPINSNFTFKSCHRRSSRGRVNCRSRFRLLRRRFFAVLQQRSQVCCDLRRHSADIPLCRGIDILSAEFRSINA